MLSARLVAVVCALAAVAGCSRLPAVAIPGSGSTDMRRLVEDRAWIATDQDAAPGSLRTFLGNGTLIMTSCGETYRLAPWRWVEGARLVWEEDGVVLRGEVVLVERNALLLMVEVGDTQVTQSYRASVPPEVCPDLPR